MNLQELYSLTSGQKIDRIDILEKFYPLNIEKYIVFQPFSKPSKCFSYWHDVLDILYIILKESGYSICQVGLLSEPLLPNCIDLRGKTTINQTGYTISDEGCSKGQANLTWASNTTWDSIGKDYDNYAKLLENAKIPNPYPNSSPVRSVAEMLSSQTPRRQLIFKNPTSKLGVENI